MLVGEWGVPCCLPPPAASHTHTISQPQIMWPLGMLLESTLSHTHTHILTLVLIKLESRSPVCLNTHISQFNEIAEGAVFAVSKVNVHLSVSPCMCVCLYPPSAPSLSPVYTSVPRSVSYALHALASQRVCVCGFLCVCRFLCISICVVRVYKFVRFLTQCCI